MKETLAGGTDGGQAMDTTDTWTLREGESVKGGKSIDSVDTTSTLVARAHSVAHSTMAPNAARSCHSSLQSDSTLKATTQGSAAVGGVAGAGLGGGGAGVGLGGGAANAGEGMSGVCPGLGGEGVRLREGGGRREKQQSTPVAQLFAPKWSSLLNARAVAHMQHTFADSADLLCAKAQAAVVVGRYLQALDFCKKYIRRCLFGLPNWFCQI